MRTVFMPFIGEYGSKLAKHCPGVNGYTDYKVVCHEEGEDAIYPGADERWTYPRPPDIGRGAAGHQIQNEIFAQVRKQYGENVKYFTDREAMKLPSVFFTPQSQHEYDIEFDVLLFPRKKEYAHGRNWPFWKEFVFELGIQDIRCLIGGQPDSCAHLGCPAVWDIVDDPVDIQDATIWAINKSKARIGSATGTTFLSALCGKPPIVITSELGMDAFGSKNGFNSGSYYRIDHIKMGWTVIAHWTDLRKVINEFMVIYNDIEAFEALAKLGVRGIKEK